MCEQKPLSVLEDDGVTLFYDFTMHTNCSIKANEPDIVAKGFKEHKYCLIDMIIPSDKKHFNKWIQWKSFSITT